MDWSTEEVLVFLRLYEREPEIWNPADPHYRHRFRIQDSWKRIAAGLGGRYTVGELKAKKLSLMATYRKLATKVRNGGDYYWQPEWFAYTAMDKFLGEIYEAKREKLTLQQDGTSEDEQAGGDGGGSKEKTKREERQPDPGNFLEVRVDEAADRRERELTPPLSEHPQRINRTTENAFSQIRRLFERPEPDECTVYGEFIAMKLRSMEKDARDDAMLELHGLLVRLKRKQGLPRRPTSALTVSEASTSREEPHKVVNNRINIKSENASDKAQTGIC